MRVASIPRSGSTRASLVLSTVLAWACACATARSQGGAHDIRDLVGVDVLSTSVTLDLTEVDGPAPRSLFSQELLRFVDGDQASAAELVEGLLTSRRLLELARCELSRPHASPELLRPSERFIPQLVLFSLAYEFSSEHGAGARQAGSQAMLILRALEEQVEDSTLLFPTFELIGPEEAALVEDTRDGAQELFPRYMQLLYKKTSANVDLADKKARIGEKLSALSAAVGAIYLTDQVKDRGAFCRGIEVLAENAGDALLWATARKGPDAAGPITARDIQIAVAVTNYDHALALAVAPRARAWVEREDGRVEDTAVRDRALLTTSSFDNKVHPGITRVRTFSGSARLDSRRVCALELIVRVAAERVAIVVPVGGCDPAKRPGTVDDQSSHPAGPRVTERAR